MKKELRDRLEAAGLGHLPWEGDDGAHTALVVAEGGAPVALLVLDPLSPGADVSVSVVHEVVLGPETRAALGLLGRTLVALGERGEP